MALCASPFGELTFTPGVRKFYNEYLPYVFNINCQIPAGREKFNQRKFFLYRKILGEIILILSF